MWPTLGTKNPNPDALPKPWAQIGLSPSSAIQPSRCSRFAQSWISLPLSASCSSPHHQCCNFNLYIASLLIDVLSSDAGSEDTNKSFNLWRTQASLILSIFSGGSFSRLSLYFRSIMYGVKLSTNYIGLLHTYLFGNYSDLLGNL